MKKMKDALLFFWQLPQWLLGALCWAFYCLKDGRKAEGMWVYCGTERIARLCVVRIGRRAAFTLGDWVFFDREWFLDGGRRVKVKDAVRHEVGHVGQSRILGWLYLPVIALPSVVMTAIAPNMVQRFYFEAWANRLSAGLDFSIEKSE